MKTLVIHVSHANSPQFEFFVKHALFQSDDVTFILVRNDSTASVEYFHSIIAPYTNVHVLIRPNVGCDFQGWNEALFLSVESLQKRIITAGTVGAPPVYTQYDRFIFANATVSGPYLPSYIKDTWVDCFAAPLSETVKLVGLSVNHITTYKILPGYIKMIEQNYDIEVTNTSHIQSMIFATDMTGLAVLMKKGLFRPTKQFPEDKTILIILHEIALTTLIFDAGFAVFSLIKAPGQGLVTRERADEIVRTQMNNPAYDDLWLIERSNSTLCETMFVKSNRGIVYPEKSRYDSFVEENYAKPVIPVCVPASSSSDWSSLPEFGFIILRHVRDANTNRYWQRAYSQIRLFHSESILIIDDNSNPACLTSLDMVNTQVIQSEFPGRGELLPYYYFHKLRPWKKAMFIHDSVFLNSRLTVEYIDDVKLLWYFPNSLARLKDTPRLLALLDQGEVLVRQYNSGSLDWVGCFGGMSVIDWQFLNKMVQRYNLFKLLDHINTRELRMSWERIFGLVCCQTKIDLATNPSIFGHYGTLLSPDGDNSYENYLATYQHKPISKVFTGR